MSGSKQRVSKPAAPTISRLGEAVRCRAHHPTRPARFPRRAAVSITWWSTRDTAWRAHAKSSPPIHPTAPVSSPRGRGT